MDTKPLQHGDDLQSLLGVLAPRVAVEFERRRAEQERAQALADLHNVMETVPDIMFTLDTQGNMVKWNRRVRDVTGYGSEELLNKPALDFVPPEEQTRTAAAIQRAFTEGYAELDGQLLTKDLRTIPYHWIGALLKNAQGEPIGISGVGRDVSGKKWAEEELRQQQRRLVDAQRLAHLGSWDWDVDTGEVKWSDEQFRIFGYEPGAIAVTYDRFLASLHPDDHAPVLAAINDALLGKRPADVEYRIVRPNGEVRFIHALGGDVHRDATGHPLSMAGTVLDITERKQVEAALRNSEERWQLAVRGSNDGIWDWNIQSGDIFFPPRWKAMRGFEDHEIKNHVDEWRSRIHPDDLDRVFQSVDAYLAKQAPEFCEEYRVLGKDGSYIWILDRGVAFWADDGTPLRMAGSESDITKRKRAEEALRESEQRLGAILKNSPTMIFLKDLDGRYLYAGKVFSDQLHLDPQVLIGKTDADLFEPDQARTFRRHDQQVVQEGMACSFEEIALHADGRHTSIVVKFPLKDSAGRIYAIGGVVTDITERKRMEEALRRREEDLRVAIEERERVSQDLHDGILQSLFAVGLALESAKSMMSPRTRKASGAPLDQANWSVEPCHARDPELHRGAGLRPAQGDGLADGAAAHAGIADAAPRDARAPRGRGPCHAGPIG